MSDATTEEWIADINAETFKERCNIEVPGEIEGLR
jgi:hypothetical protein